MLFILCNLCAIAQNINVTSFQLLDNDLTANTAGTIERDQNGEVAALIKVVTTEQGFVFDGGMVGVVKTKQGVGEIWVYVPHGIKKITIQHPQLGVLRDYYFPIAIEKAKTYEMKLTTGKVETIITHSINKQFVIFKVSPSNAVVELGDDMLCVDSEGYVEKGVPFGTYSYRVSCEDYYTEAGQIVVNDQGKVEIDISLRPKFGWIKFEAIDEYHGAYVYVDNKRVGQLPLKTEGIKSGTHQIKIAKSLHKTYEQQVTVADNEVLTLNVRLTPNFANITLNSDEESEIWLDGQLKGKGSWTGALEIGEYKVETKKESHRTRTEIVQITNLASRTIQLPAPTPIYGSAEITSSPTNATVLIDGIEMGKTPLILNNILAGVCELKFRRDGYIEQTKIMDIIENGHSQIEVELVEEPKEVMINITSTPNHATILIDGKEVGKTPLNVPLRLGTHSFRASKKEYYPLNKGENVTVTFDKIHFNLDKYPKVKDGHNDYYNCISAYSEINIENFNKSYGKGCLLGIYLGGWNLEMAYQSNIYNQFDVRMGWGIRFGRNLLITPQWGMANLFYNVETFDSYWGYEKEKWSCYSFACRIQYCLSKHIALSISPEHVFLSDYKKKFYLEELRSEYMGGWYIRTGVVFNIGDRWDKIWFNP